MPFLMHLCFSTWTAIMVLFFCWDSFFVNSRDILLKRLQTGGTCGKGSKLSFSLLFCLLSPPNITTPPWKSSGEAVESSPSFGTLSLSTPVKKKAAEPLPRRGKEKKK